MDIESLVGKTVRLTLAGIEFQDPYLRPKIGCGEETITRIVQVESVDQLGIWVQIPDYPVYNSVDRKKDTHVALMLIRFEYITSIVHFPDVAEDDSKLHRIGFSAEDEF